LWYKLPQITGIKPIASCWVLYPPLRGIVQLTNSATLRFRNWSFTIKYSLSRHVRFLLFYSKIDILVVFLPKNCPVMKKAAEKAKKIKALHIVV
jgi:hypothetical protein